MATDEWLRGLLMYRRWKRRDWLPFAERSFARVRSEGNGAAVPLSA